MTIMFAKQAQIAVAALTLSIAGGAFAQSSDRNVFDSKAALQLPAAVSANGLTREAVRAQVIAGRAALTVASFNSESAVTEQTAGAGSAIAALFQGGQRSPQVASANGLSRADVRAEVIAARANGELNVFDTETDLRVPASVRREATTLAQR
jgi:hypothetical protein